MTASIRNLQVEIAALYSDLVETKLADEIKAQKLVGLIRALEAELIEMRKAQPGHYISGG